MSPVASIQSGLTLRQILEMPAVRRAVPELVAAESALDQVVRWVHAGEVSYIASMLKGGELLLTTGLGIGHSADEQRRFIAELSEQGVLALAVELGPRFKAPPKALVEEAEARGLALIVFHRQVAFIDITEAVHSEIISHQLNRLRHSEQVHQRFFSLVLDGAGTTEILAALAGMTGGPVFLERTGQGLIYHDSAGQDEGETLAGWDSFRRGLAQAPTAVEHYVPLGGERRWGRVVAFTPGRIPTDADQVALERAVEVIALALLRDREEETVRGRERGNFLVGLLRGDFRETTARERAASLGMGSNEALVPLIASRSPDLSRGREQTVPWSRVWADLQAAVAQRRLPLVAGTREHDRELLAVVGLRKGAERVRVLDLIAELIHDACQRRLGDPGALIVCAGPECRNWSETASALASLAEELPVATQLPPRAWHDFGSPSLDRLLWGLGQDEELARFVSGRLGPLMNTEGRHRDRLLETLEVYCRHAGRKAETARALNIERQSLYHRLRRIEEILGIDLADGETLTDIHLALRARRASAV